MILMSVIFEAVTVVLMKIQVFWHTHCVTGYEWFPVLRRITVPSFWTASPLKMKAV